MIPRIPPVYPGGIRGVLGGIRGVPGGIRGVFLGSLEYRQDKLAVFEGLRKYPSNTASHPPNTASHPPNTARSHQIPPFHPGGIRGVAGGFRGVAGGIRGMAGGIRGVFS